MEIKPLSKEVISKIRCTSNVNNLTQCVTELVLNSLDAKSSAVAIRLNSVSFRIQVVDNGIGISQENLDKIGRKYSTSKCQSLLDLEKKPKTYGYRGESLWSISNVSKTCIITSKYSTSEKTFSKSIHLRKHGKVIVAKNRQSVGTTITIDGFFYNLPVRQKRMKKEFEVEEIINFLKSMSIIQSQISITLRDDLTGKLLFKRPKCANVIKSFTDLYPDIKFDDTVVMKVHKDKISIEALLLRDIFKEKSVQHIFVNKRPVRNSKLQTFICKKLAKDKKKLQLHPTFLFNIKCSLSTYSIIYENSEAKVEFLNIDLIDLCIEKLILNFLGKTKPLQEANEIHENRKSVCGVSDLGGAVKGFGFKNWLQRNEINEEGSGVIEDVIEQSELQVKQARINKLFEKDKLKSLPIKICQQKRNKIGRIYEENQNKQEINKNEKEKNLICIPTHSENVQEKIMMNNFHRLEKNCKNIISKRIPEETLFSNFTSTEEKGKDFLMYMFLKSTEIFNGDKSQEQPTEIPEDNGNLNASIETIMESNIFFQNITKTKNHQLNENISVSVRLKRRKNVEAHFPDKFTFSPPEPKKRKAQYASNKGNNKSKKNSLSPYFEAKNKSKRTTIEKQHVMKTCNFFMGDDLKNNIFFPEQFDDKNLTKLNSCLSKINNNSEYIERNDMGKCFDQWSKGNFCFLNITKKGLLGDINKSYIFNFENVVKNDDFSNKRLFKAKSRAKNDPRENLALAPSGNFDFENLPFSPIPKIQKPSEDIIKNEKQNRTLFVPTEKNKTTWRKYVSDGDYRRTSSPYFTREKFKYVRKYHDDPSFSLNTRDISHKKIEGKCTNQIFRKFHTDPFDHSRLKKIQIMKQNIDKLFLNSKSNEKNVISFTTKNETGIYTRDSLEHNRKDELLSSSPLWQKFIKNKSKCVRNKNFKELPSVKNKKNYFKNTPKKITEYLKEKTTLSRDNIGESPDLFSDVIFNSANRLIEKPETDLTFLPNSAFSFDIDTVFGGEKDCRLEDLRTLTAVGTAKSSNLIITLDMEEENTAKRDAEMNTNTAGPSEDGWIKKFDLEGNEFYFNERTGMTSFLRSKKEDVFVLKERMKFIPKGLSPILIPDQILEKSLSPVSKEKLHERILKAYADDLGLVKWEKCIKGCDPKKFFENLFRERVNEYEKEVPNIIRRRMPQFALKSSYDHKFNKMVFKNLTVIGQIDQKFIAAVDKRKLNLILFDQHAVHERIRLENLLKEYEGKSSTCENVTLFMNQTDLGLLKEHHNYLNGIGVHFRFLKNGITVVEIPTCFLNKITKECPLPKLLQLFIREILDLVKETRGVLTGLPTMMNQIINMEACRGSVKFGEFLSRKEMEKLIEDLSQCMLPFQCAHGRPTLVPLITLDDTLGENIEKPNLGSLKHN